MDKLATSGIENNYSDYMLGDGTYVSCKFIDSGGAYRFRITSEVFYPKVDGCILVFDITDQKSFDDIKDYIFNYKYIITIVCFVNLMYYIPKVQELCKENIPVVILGNKKDLNDSRVISIEEAFELASKYDYTYKEVSCIENYNLIGIFADIIEKSKSYVEQKSHYENNLIENRNSINDVNTVLLNNENSEINQQRKKCCKCY